MSFNFLGLPPELRTRIYEMLLVQQMPINLVFLSRKLTLGLLGVNKKVYQEAKAVLYTKNSFDLVYESCMMGTRLLERMAMDNASCIRHLRIDLPEFTNFWDLYPDHIIFERDSDNLLKAIQRYCTNLCSLSIYIDGGEDGRFLIEGSDHPVMITVALELMNSYFKAMTSLQKVFIEIYEDCLWGDVREQMESHGWIVRLKDIDDYPDEQCKSDGSYNSAGDREDTDDDDIDSDSVAEEVDA